MRSTVRALALLACSGFAAAQTPPATRLPGRTHPHERGAWEPAELPDVVVFVLDDVGAVDIEELSAASPASRVPAIDALAAQGTRFERGYGQPMCAPARVSLYLSTWLGTSGGRACENGDLGPSAETLPHGLTSLPKVMETAGYHTALIGRWGLGTTPFADPGEEEYVWAPHLWGFESWRAGVPDGTAACIPVGGYSNWLRVDDGETSTSSEYNTIAIRDAFLSWWLATPSPRFAVVALQAAHMGGLLDEWHIPPPGAMPPGWVPPPVPDDREEYLAMVQSADYAVGRMLEAVSLQRTLVVLCADNGTPQEVHPPGYTLNNVKFSTFDGGVRVPFVVAGLGFPSAGVSDQPVSLVDLVPTLADLAGLPVPHEFDGQSLLPALWGEPLPRDWVYVQNPKNAFRAVVLRRPDLGGIGMRTWKLRVSPSFERLYDLDADPREQSPLDPDDPAFADVAAALRAALAEAQS